MVVASLLRGVCHREEVCCGVCARYRACWSWEGGFEGKGDACRWLFVNVYVRECHLNGRACKSKGKMLKTRNRPTST